MTHGQSSRKQTSPSYHTSAFVEGTNNLYPPSSVDPNYRMESRQQQQYSFDNESVYSEDTVLAEKEEANSSSKSRSKKFRLFGRRSHKPEKKEKKEKKETTEGLSKDEFPRDVQEVIDAVYKKYPLAALNSTLGSRPSML